MSSLTQKMETIRNDYFSTRGNAVISSVCIALLLWIGWTLVDWGLLNAKFSADEGIDGCRAVSGACWAVIDARARLIFFGLYPYEEHWRSALACLAIILVTVLSCIPCFWTTRRLAFLWLAGFATFYVLMRGGVLGMTEVLETEWGGLALTLFIFSAVCIVGMPMAIVFALLRRSQYTVIATTMALVIDGIRSLPLLSIMFTAALVLTFVLPDWLQGDKLYRVIFGYSLFFACYQAEIIRGGMQSLPAGQEEAAKALGLNYFQRISRIVLPQAFRNALPPTINQFVVTFKETSLVTIVGFFDVLASGNAAFSSGEWLTTYVEVYFFVALIYFSFVFSLSRYGAYLETRLRVGQH
ncbi:amino acid ABC transporter permease [Kiloniella sp. b19]|uniref:amino acid ABC transporter permease n=1 Tax=Kiloniella sp. GXU_MW_B19 TaxID=3141326 RepID=UPI0031D4B952